MAATTAISSGDKTARRYHFYRPVLPDTQGRTFCKLKREQEMKCEDLAMSSGSEFSFIAGASNLTDLGDLVEFGNLQKKEQNGWPKEKSKK